MTYTTKQLEAIRELADVAGELAGTFCHVEFGGDVVRVVRACDDRRIGLIFGSRRFKFLPLVSS